MEMEIHFRGYPRQLNAYLQFNFSKGFYENEILFAEFIYNLPSVRFHTCASIT